ncbi:hypothetical protein Neosp_011020 [[Neocosmospora] mangrovei]
MSGLEILGAVASSIALAQAVQGTIKAVNLLREIRQIRQQCDDLKKEAVQELQGILKALNQIMSKYSNDRKWHDPRRIARKMHWLTESKNIEELARKAQNTKLNLHLAITLRTSSSVDRIGTQQEVILHSIKQRTVYYLEGSQQSPTRLLSDSVPGSIQDSVIGRVEGQVEEIESEGDSCSETREDSTQSTTDSLQLSGFQSLSLADESGGCVISTKEEIYTSFTTIQPLGTRRCRQDCQCRCHGHQLEDDSYSWISTVFGSWNVGYDVNFMLTHVRRRVNDDNARHILTKVLSLVQGGRRMRRIHQIAKQGDTAQMRQTLREQPEAIDEFDSCGRAPIHYAVLFENIDVLEQLILAGADTIRQDSVGDTPLVVAALNGYEEAAQILLQNDQCRRHVDLQQRSGATALQYAVKAASPEIVYMLLEAGASADKRDLFGCTPLHCLASSQADQQTAHRIIRLLQGQHARLDAQDNLGATALLRAVIENNTPILRALVDAGASLNTTTTSSDNILHLAACHADLEMISILAEQNLTLVDPRLRDVPGYTPLGKLGWCWQAEDWQLIDSLRRPSPEEQQKFIALYFDLLCHYLLRHMSTLKQLLRAAEQRDTSTSNERIAALIQKSNVTERIDMVGWYRGIQGNVRDGNWDQVVLDVQDEYDEAYEELGRAGVARNKTLADPEVFAFA